MKAYPIVLALAAGCLLAACSGGAEKKYNIGEPAKLDNAVDSLSWSYGVNFANTLSMGLFDSLDKATVVQAVCHTLEGKPQPMDDQAIREALEYLSFLQTTSQIQQAKRQAAKVDSLQKAYLENLKRTNPNVKEHPKGFFYEVLREGQVCGAHLF